MIYSNLISSVPFSARSAFAPGRGALRLLAVLLALGLALPALAQDAPIPDRFATMRDNTDFPGGDLTPVFDTTLEHCHATCLRLGDCAGFTFNRRAGACFPKSRLGQPAPFEGAVSGVISAVAAQARDLAQEARAQMVFLSAPDFDAAREQAETVALNYFANGLTEGALLQGAAQRGGRDAVAWTGAAVTVADSGAAWLAHARALADLAEAEQANRFALNRRAASAALNAALRLPRGPQRAGALMVMASAQENIWRGEEALAAARLAEQMQPGIAPAQLARLRARFGFRLLDHDIDARSASPRICARFSEPLSATRDYAPYLTSPTAGLALEVEGAQLCVSGIQYGESYELSFRAGLPAASGEVLVQDTPLQAYIRDRTPLVRFPGRGYVLPASGPRALPVETVNADQLELSLLRVSDRNLVTAIRQGSFARALSQWEGERFEEMLTEPVWQGQARLEGALNRTTTSRLPLEEAGALDSGIYVLRASVAGGDPYLSAPAMQWFLVSDLGLTSLSGSDGLHVVVQALSDGQPVQGAEVELLAQSNRVLGQAVTDAQGHARFDAGLARGAGASAPALLVVTSADGQDMAVLSLAEPEFDLSDRGVAGRAAPGPVDLFVTPDRGVYRAGETIRLTALVRDHRARAIHDLPLAARLIRPDGVEYARYQGRDARAGGYVFALPLGGDVPRGVWRIELHSDPDAPALASQTVLVEDFLPERVDASLSLAPDAPIDLAAPPMLSVSARHLFGPPAAGLGVSGHITLRTTEALEGWPGFRFGRHDQRLDPQRRALPRGLMTDAGGNLALALPLEGVRLDNRPYQGELTVTLLDGASRPVERRLERALRPTGPVIGIRPGFDGDALPENSEARFDLVLVGPDGAAMQGRLDWQVDRVMTRYQWFSMDGRWNWEPVTTRARIAEGQLDSAADPASLAVPVDWGRHELRVTWADGDQAASASIPFTAGWYAADTARETPDMLELALDQPAYAPGDTARLRLAAADPGMALVSVLSDRVVDMQLVAVAGETVIDLPVTEDWGSGAYVTASLIRPEAQADLPARAIGLAHASIDPGAAALEVTLDAPVEAMPRSTVDVALRLPAGSDGPAYATLAAVDLGALTLTGFEPPDPLGHYFGQRQLGVALRDLYGRLIDAHQGALGQVRSGGDAMAGARPGPVAAEDVLALFTGPVALVDGQAQIALDLPAFNGTVRMMAVVWSDSGVGQASADMLVRDPVVVQPSLPRFLTPGDQSRLRLELTHATGPAGLMALSVEGHGLGAVPDSVTLAEGGAQILDLPLAPTMPGMHPYHIRLTTPDGQVLTRDIVLSVQHTDPEIARQSRFTLAPGQVFHFDAAALDGLRPGTAQATLVAGPAGALDMAGLIRHLHGYPYGCTEQIASALQPLLLAGHVVAEMGLITSAEAEARISAALDILLTRQDRRGSFGLWGAGGQDLWLDAYVTDVLLRAEAQGASLPETALRMALDNLRNQVARDAGLYDGAEAVAYALLVLARAGEAAIGDLRYYADTLAERFDTPLSAAQLGAALAAYGEAMRADAMFARARDLALAGDAPQGWRGDYGTMLRDQAGVLALALEARSAAVDPMQMAGLLHDAALRPDRMSPQEAVWALKAALALGAEAQGLQLDGQPVAGNVLRLLDGPGAQIRNGGPRDVTVTLTAFGVPETPPEASGRGYAITRSYFTTDGAEADLSALRPGDRLVTVLDIRPDRGIEGGRLMVDDALPAGFEIDNANLLRAGDIRALDWLNVHDSAEMTEARADRFLAAVDWTSDAPLRLAYIVRAVSGGDFHHPAAKVEDMYRPTNRAVSATGRVRILP